jgi:hypothetical protein
MSSQRTELSQARVGTEGFVVASAAAVTPHRLEQGPQLPLT